MTIDNPDQMMRTVLPPALEVLTAWSIAETENDPSIFREAMDRTIGDAARSDEPLRDLARMMFGLSSLSGILLDELAHSSGRTRGAVLQGVHHRYLHSAD
jgi:hypothetical protein